MRDLRDRFTDELQSLYENGCSFKEVVKAYLSCPKNVEHLEYNYREALDEFVFVQHPNYDDEMLRYLYQVGCDLDYIMETLGESDWELFKQAYNGANNLSLDCCL